MKSCDDCGASPGVEGVSVRRCEVCEESTEMYACIKCVRFSERSCRESAAEDERSAIVAWLRDWASVGNIPDGYETADRIEKGEHLKK